MRRLLAGGLAAAAAVLLAAAPADAYTDAGLRARLAREMRAAPATSGAYVRDMDSGAELFALRQDAPRIPASVEKLFTTSAALLRLGPAATLTTAAVRAPDAVVEPDGTLRGDLVLVGGGDPFFGDTEAAALVRDVQAAGIARVDGAIVGDESAFDARRSGCCDGYDRDLGGVLSALAYDGGMFHGHARLDAARFAAARFAARLRKAGVAVVGRSRAGVAPPGAVTVAAVPSRSVAELARLVNVPSNNFAAEMLLKTLGARFGSGGATAEGAQVAARTLASIGVRARIVDGSGLSRRNRATPREVVGLLERMRAGEAGAAFRASLAVTGASGTVRARVRRTVAARRCHVKTGTLRDVSALAGYCHTLGGREIGFALMFNHASTFAAKAREDRIVTAIVRLAGAPAPAPAPAPPGGGTIAHTSSASSPASSSTATPSRSAFSSFEPGEAPATT